MENQKSNTAKYILFVGIESTCSGMVYLGTSYNEGLFAEYFK